MKNLFAAAAVLVGFTVFADSTPVMVSLVTPVQAPAADYDVTGLRLSLIYGEAKEFTGLDIGIANRSSADFTGLGIGGANIVNGKFIGAQLGLVNWNDNFDLAWGGTSIGLQLGVYNHAGSFCGCQDGVVNVSTDRLTGLQCAFVNIAETVHGVQCGAYLFLGVNVVNDSLNGCQFGIVNYAAHIEAGLQIGLVNIAGNGWFPVLPIVNGSF